jgi:hypothetical protein
LIRVEECIDYVADWYLKTEDKEDTDLLHRRLDGIKQDIDDGATISKEDCDAFDKLGQLIPQVIKL